ncbi:hypothetical protein F4781DRAFT_388152 [Annulohypoxylon bovei var. microspora]|nr:hypothetical protein F4781DRAFT_388152 [Annulohypoxylon bovei var. microspora]
MAASKIYTRIFLISAVVIFFVSIAMGHPMNMTGSDLTHAGCNCTGGHNHSSPHFMDGPPMDGPPMDGPLMDGPPMDDAPMDGPPMGGPGNFSLGFIGQEGNTTIPDFYGASAKKGGPHRCNGTHTSEGNKTYASLTESIVLAMLISITLAVVLLT